MYNIKYVALEFIVVTKGHFTHKPTTATMKLWEPKRKCPKAIPRHLQYHVAWSQTPKCGVKSYVTGPSAKCYFNEFLFMRILTHDEIKETNGCEHLEYHGLPVISYQTFLQEVVFDNSDHETWSIQWHVGIHIDLTSTLHSHARLVPQAY